MRMPRTARLSEPYHVHHVTARSIPERRLFCDAEDRRYFMQLLETLLKKTGFTLYDWNLMRNHYHLVLRTSGLHLQELMRPLNSAYARYYNRKYKRRGPLFDGRYKSVVALRMDYVRTLLAYVDLNPVKAKVCHDLESLAHYPWCGYSALMGNHPCSFQATDEVLRSYAEDPQEARRLHREFVESVLRKKEEGAEEVIAAVQRSNHEHADKNDPTCWVLGDVGCWAEAFRRAGDKLARMGQLRKQGWTLDSLAAFVEEQLGLAPGALRTPHGHGACSQARKAFAYLAYRMLGETQVAAGVHMGVSGQAVSAMVQQGEQIARESGIIEALEHSTRTC